MKSVKLLAVLGVALLAFSNTQGGDKKEAKKDQDLIQGTWEVKELSMGGKPAPAELLKSLKVVFKGDTMTLSGLGDKSKEFKFTLDSTKKPKAIDTIPQDGPFKGKTGPAIYQLDGDVLKLAIPNGDGAERPKEFAAPEGSNIGLFVLIRPK